MHCQTHKKVSFSDSVTVVYLKDGENRVGTWYSDGCRFRMRVLELESILGPILKIRLGT